MTLSLVRLPAALLLVWFAACGDASAPDGGDAGRPGGPAGPFVPLVPGAGGPGTTGAGGGGGSPPAGNGRVDVTPSAVDSMRPERTVQLAATVYDAAGKVVPGAAVTWRSERRDVLAVSATGAATAVPLSGFGTGAVVVTATSGEAQGRARFTFDAWSVATNDGTGASRVTAFVRGPLAFRCAGGVLEASFRTPRLADGGRVEFHLDRGPTRVETWAAPDGAAGLVYPGDARQLAREVAAADVLEFRYTEFGGAGAVVRTDFLRGLAPYLPRLAAECP